MAFITLVCYASTGVAQQYAADALRFSYTGFGGTSRFHGIAGAQTALGGDAGSFAGNPAGLGFYRRSDFTFTPALQFSNARSTYMGKMTDDEDINFNISNLSIVFNETFQDYTGQDVTKGWTSLSFGLGINRINNFNENRTFSAFNPNSSMTQYFAESANKYGLGEGSFEELAYNAYLINEDSVSFIPASKGNVNQSQRDDQSGAMTEWSLALGANYSNKLYLGGALGVTSIRYLRESSYTETGINDTLYNVTGFTMDETHLVNGSGFNLKGGVILRPIDMIRIGATIQTPTYYELDESFSTSVTTSFGSSDTSYGPLEYFFNYDLKAPFRYNLGLAIFIGKLGFISADVEQVDYTSARIRTHYEVEFDNDNNQAIRENFTSATNYRIGAESRLGPFNIRAGYALYGNPNKDRSYDASRKYITGGFGYRVENYYFDLAWVNTSWSSVYVPYYLDDSSIPDPEVSVSHKKNTVLFTVGSRF